MRWRRTVKFCVMSTKIVIMPWVISLYNILELKPNYIETSNKGIGFVLFWSQLTHTCNHDKMLKQLLLLNKYLHIIVERLE